jgi:hypothetical protein
LARKKSQLTAISIRTNELNRNQKSKNRKRGAALCNPPQLMTPMGPRAQKGGEQARVVVPVASGHAIYDAIEPPLDVLGNHARGSSNARSTTPTPIVCGAFQCISLVFLHIRSGFLVYGVPHYLSIERYVFRTATCIRTFLQAACTPPIMQCTPFPFPFPPHATN